jgi:hypothetical protein
MKLLTDMKTKVKHAVDFAYEFRTCQAPDSIGRNASRAQALLTQTAFIYRVRLVASYLQPAEHPNIVCRNSISWNAHVIHIGIP